MMSKIFLRNITTLLLVTALFFAHVTTYADINSDVEKYTTLIQNNPNNDSAYNNRGVVYNNLKQYEQAVQDFNKAIQLNPNLAEAFYNRGSTYYNLGKYEQALQDYDKAISINPNDASFYNNRGLTYANGVKKIQASCSRF